MDDQIAPLFEAAGLFQLIEIDSGEIGRSHSVPCTQSEDYRRVRLLQVHGVTVLICNGIKRTNRDTLDAAGVEVVSGQTGSVSQALNLFSRGQLTSQTVQECSFEPSSSMSRQELTSWARDLFGSCGYNVERGCSPDLVLVDLVATIKCPACGRPIKIAVCCGAHTHCVQSDIQEFHRRTAASFNARVFVCPQDPNLSQLCDEYGIEMVSPENNEPEPAGPMALPILRGAVRDHDRLQTRAEK